MGQGYAMTKDTYDDLLDEGQPEELCEQQAAE